MQPEETLAASGSATKIHVVGDNEGLDDRPVIRIESGQCGNMVRSLERIVAEYDPDVYQRERELVTVGREPDTGAEYKRDRRSGAKIVSMPGTPKITVLSASGLRARSSDLVHWMRFNRKYKEWESSDPDKETIQSLLKADTLGYWPNIRVLRGIRECPFIAPSGRAITGCGYDQETGFLLDSTVDVGELPESPTQDQARAALRYLWTELFVDFPFEGLGESANSRDDGAAYERYESARSNPGAFVALSTALTIVARPAIQGATLSSLFEANTQGAGKSLQSNIVARITTGRSASVVSFPSSRDGGTNDEEMRKVICAYALAGASMVTFDNIKGEIGGGALEGAMTAEDRWEGRKLGTNETVSLPWSAVLLLNGNNAAMTPDVAQRIIMSRLDSEHENPREKPPELFRHPSLQKWITEHRNRIIRACLVVLRAYLVAKDKPKVNLGSFEAWSALIPGAIMYAGGPNVILAQPRGSITESTEIQAYRSLIRSWPALDFRDGAKISEIVKFANFEIEREIDRGFTPPDGLADLRAALRDMVSARPESIPRPVDVGNAMRAFRGKWVDGAKIDSRPDRTNTQIWYMTRRNQRNGGDP